MKRGMCELMTMKDLYGDLKYIDIESKCAYDTTEHIDYRREITHNAIKRVKEDKSNVECYPRGTEVMIITKDVSILPKLYGRYRVRSLIVIDINIEEISRRAFMSKLDEFGAINCTIPDDIYLYAPRVTRLISIDNDFKRYDTNIDHIYLGYKIRVNSMENIRYIELRPKSYEGYIDITYMTGLRFIAAPYDMIYNTKRRLNILKHIDTSLNDERDVSKISDIIFDGASVRFSARNMNTLMGFIIDSDVEIKDLSITLDNVGFNPDSLNDLKDYVCINTIESLRINICDDNIMDNFVSRLSNLRYLRIDNYMSQRCLGEFNNTLETLHINIPINKLSGTLSNLKHLYLEDVDMIDMCQSYLSGSLRELINTVNVRIRSMRYSNLSRFDLFKLLTHREIRSVKLFNESLKAILYSSEDNIIGDY